MVQTIRNRTLSEVAFPEGGIPKYGAAMMQPKYCGKWAVSDSNNSEAGVYVRLAVGAGSSSQRVAQGQFQQSTNFYEIGEIIRDAGVPLRHTRSATIT